MEHVIQYGAGSKRRDRQVIQDEESKVGNTRSTYVVQDRAVKYRMGQVI